MASRFRRGVVAAIENLVKDPVEAPAIIEFARGARRLASAKVHRRSAPSRARVAPASLTKWFAKGYAAGRLPQRRRGSGRIYSLPWSDFLGGKNGSEDPPLQEKERPALGRRALTGVGGNLQKGHGYRTIMRVREITLQGNSD